MMKRALVVIVLIVGLGFLSGCLTGSIQGQVLDAEDRPVEGAIVTTDPPTHSVRTTAEGYSIENIPTDEYRVRARKPGYKEGRTDVTVQWNTTIGADIQIEREE